MSVGRRVPLWVWWVVVILLVCLPWPGMKPHAQSKPQFIPFTGVADRPKDVLANLVLFLPFGYLFAAAHPRRGYVALLAAAAAISLGAEALQTLSPARFPSATDVVVNTAGAFVGGWSQRRLTRQRLET